MTIPISTSISIPSSPFNSIRGPRRIVSLLEAYSLRASTHLRWSTWWPFVLLCLLAATRWILTGAFPETATTLLSASAGCAAAALIAFFWQRKSQPVQTPQSSSRSLLAGALLLTGPFFSLLLSGHGIDPNGITLSLALVPIIAAVAQNALSTTAAGSFAARTWPALAAITGLLLLIPQPSFTNPLRDAVFLLTPLATGIGAALFSTVASQQHDSRAFTSALSSAALLFAVAWLIHLLLHNNSAHLSSLAAFLDGVAALLTLLSLSRIGLSRWSSQFALVPLTVILQGFVLLRPTINPYNSSGLALLLLGSIFLLLPQLTEKAL